MSSPMEYSWLLKKEFTKSIAQYQLRDKQRMELCGKEIASNNLSIIVLGTYACTAGSMEKNGCKGYTN